MPAVNRGRLLALSDREFRRTSGTPEPQPAATSFRPPRVNLGKYDTTWDAKRSRAARLMAVLLRENDAQLADRVCESPTASRTYGGAAEWLASEARYLRKVASMMDNAAGRLGVVLQRCNGTGAGAGAAAVQS